MPPERQAADDPREWLKRAHSSLEQARARPSGVCFEDLCFCAQQAAEKAMKALLLSKGVGFPFIHDLGELLRLLQKEGESIPDIVRDAAELTDYAVETRYPGLAEPVTQLEYERALKLAETVVQWADRRLNR